MVKPLPGLGLWLWSRLLTLLAHLHATLLWLVSMPRARPRAPLRPPPPEPPGEGTAGEEPWPESLPEPCQRPDD